MLKRPVLIRLRKEKGLSVTAAAAQIGLHQRTLRRYEDGETNPGQNEIEMIMEFYQVGYAGTFEVEDDGLDYLTK